jgi:hypothetical protein
MKTVFPFALFIYIFSCVNFDDSGKGDNPEFESCLGIELNSLFEKADSLLDSHIKKYYTSDGQNLKEGYLKYLAAWSYLNYDSLIIDIIPNSEEEKRILKSKELLEVFDWSLNLGDTTYLVEPRTLENYPSDPQLLNEIQFNVKGKFAECIRESKD